MKKNDCWRKYGCFDCLDFNEKLRQCPHHYRCPYADDLKRFESYSNYEKHIHESSYVRLMLFTLGRDRNE